MSYRMEIDALNALLKEQQRTNELLEIIVKQRGEEHEDVKPIRSTTRKTGK